MRFLKSYKSLFEELSPETYLSAYKRLSELGYSDRANSIKTHYLINSLSEELKRDINSEFEKICLFENKPDNIIPELFIKYENDEKYIIFSYYEEFKSFVIDKKSKLYKILHNYSINDIELILIKYFNDYFPNYEIIEYMSGYLNEYYRKSINEELELKTYLDASDKLQNLGYSDRADNIYLNYIKKNKSITKNMVVKSLYFDYKKCIEYLKDKEEYHYLDNLLFIKYTNGDREFEIIKSIESIKIEDLNNIINEYSFEKRRIYHYLFYNGMDKTADNNQGVIIIHIDKFLNGRYNPTYDILKKRIEEYLKNNEELSNDTYLSASMKLSKLGYSDRASKIMIHSLKHYFEKVKFFDDIEKGDEYDNILGHFTEYYKNGKKIIRLHSQTTTNTVYAVLDESIRRILKDHNNIINLKVYKAFEEILADYFNVESIYIDRFDDL